MAKIVGEVAIDVTADVGPLARQMKKGESSLNSFEGRAQKMAAGLGKALGIGVVSAGALATAMVGMTRASMANIDALSKQARQAGVSVSAFQAMAMVAEEAGVATDDLSKILVKMQDNIVNLQLGTKAQTEQFERLGLSIADLSGLTADEQFKKISEALNGISDPAAKTAAALDVFGKSGAAAINMLDGYAGAVSNAAKFQAQFGIAISDVDAQNIEKANDAIGRMGLAFQGMGNILAANAAPALESMANTLLTFTARVMGSKTSLEEFFGTLENARSILGEGVFNKLVEDTGLVLAHVEQLAQIEGIYTALQGTIASTSDELARYVVQLRAVGEAGAAEAVDSLVRSMDELQAEFEAGNITAEEFERRMVALQDEAKAVVVELGNIDAVGFGGVIDRLGALGAALAGAAAEAVKLRQAMPGGVEERSFPGKDKDDLGGPVSSFAPGRSPRAGQRPIDWLPGDSDKPGSGGGKGKGGAGADKMSSRIEALIESLKTEQEILAEWYEQSLEALNAASDAELAAIGGKHLAMQRLEEEHQKRLLEIQGSSQQQRLGEVAGFFGALASVTAAGGDKMAKATATFAAVEGTINAYRAALQALADPKLGFFGKFAAYASVLAAGLKGVAAIKSAGKVSGGGGIGGGIGAQSQAPQPPTQNFIIDAPGMNIGSLVESLNRAADAGYRIRVNAA